MACIMLNSDRSSYKYGDILLNVGKLIPHGNTGPSSKP